MPHTQDLEIPNPDDVGAVLSRPDFDRNSLYRIVLGCGLLTADHTDWAQHRRLLQPTFSARGVGALEQVMTTAINGMLDRWRQVAEQGQSLDITREMTDVTLTIILSTLFGDDATNLDPTILETFPTFLKVLGEVSRATFEPMPTVSASQHRELKGALKAYDAAVLQLIERRRQLHDPGHDLLSVMLQPNAPGMEKPLTDREVRDELTTFILTGYETTATLLAWCWRVLSEHPEIEQKLCDELCRVVGQRTACAADLLDLPYMKMVIKETLRLYPPVWHLYRRSTDATEIGGYHVRAKSAVLVSPYLLHRDPAYWTEPERFEPERFSPERVSKIPRHVYVPFGDGPHVCIGQYFAMMEAKLVLARTLPRFRLRKVARRQIEMNPMVTLRPKQPLDMTLEIRS